AMDQNALEAYRTVASLDTTDARSTLAAAQILLDRIVVDSVTPLDSAAVALADTLLQQTVARDSSPPIRLNVAVLYLRPASEFARNQHGQLAADWAQKTVDNATAGASFNPDAGQQLIEQGNFWLGLSLVGIASGAYRDAFEAESCDLVSGAEEMVSRGRSALVAGAGVSPPTAQQMLGFYQQMADNLPLMREQFGCSS
ncbi:MAG: hypothetical protein ACE5FJ_04560, partial [Gemmatimonadales bacterium]